MLFEDRYFHWVTERALKDLEDRRVIVISRRELSFGARINLVWHRSNRYTTQAVMKLLKLTERYCEPEFTKGLGNTGELMVSDAFGRFQFVQMGRDVVEYEGRRLAGGGQNLDFVFTRDGLSCGIEVKNTLSYIDRAVLDAKLELCEALGVTPIFVVRIMPKVWINEIRERGGFTLMLKYWLFPPGHKGFADEIKNALGIPADAPRALYDGTMQRVMNWHLPRVGGGMSPAPGKPGLTNIESLKRRLKEIKERLEEGEKRDGTQ